MRKSRQSRTAHPTSTTSALRTHARVERTFHTRTAPQSARCSTARPQSADHPSMSGDTSPAPAHQTLTPSAARECCGKSSSLLCNQWPALESLCLESFQQSRLICFVLRTNNHGKLEAVCKLRGRVRPCIRHPDQVIQLLPREAHQVHVELEIPKLIKLNGQQVRIPRGSAYRQLIIRNHVGALLSLSPTRGHHHRHLGPAKRLSGQYATMTGNNPADLIHQHRIRESPLTHAGRQRLDLLGTVRPGIPGIRHQISYETPLNPISRPLLRRNLRARCQFQNYPPSNSAHEKNLRLIDRK